MKPRRWIETPPTSLRLPDLAGKSAVVTGATAGIGQATAELLLENGVRVFGLSDQPSSSRSPAFVPLQCNLSNVEEISAAFDSISEQNKHLDYIVNVAGIDPKYFIDEVSARQWNELVDVNLRAYYFIIKYALPLLRLGEGRSIVNVSSINYRLGVPGRAIYSATKAGILGLTTGLSRELGRENIRVNTVTPGWVFTPRQIEEYFSDEEAGENLDYLAQQQSLKIKITAGDIANHILFYLSNASRASVAHNCVVDGGWILE